MKPAPGTVILEARSVGFSYSKPVIRDFSLKIPAGVITGLIGPNGAGKTTILRLLDGILKPQTGSVILSGAGQLHTLKRRRIASRIAMAPQNGTIFAWQNVFQFAMQGRSPHLSLLGFESAADEEITLKALESTRLGGYLETPVSDLSGGEKQRLLLARALAQEPEVLLVDELTANLDIKYQVELMGLIVRITREKGLATVIVSHEINLLAGFADQVALVDNGAVYRHGTAAQVITAENLTHLFGMDFTVRLLDNGSPEVIPVIHKGKA